MDPVVRQVGQHIEMEPEWEAAFTLQMKLTHIISMIQEWCSTDVRHSIRHTTLRIVAVGLTFKQLHFVQISKSELSGLLEYASCHDRNDLLL